MQLDPLQLELLNGDETLKKLYKVVLERELELEALRLKASITAGKINLRKMANTKNDQKKLAIEEF